MSQDAKKLQFAPKSFGPPLIPIFFSFCSMFCNASCLHPGTCGRPQDAIQIALLHKTEFVVLLDIKFTAERSIVHIILDPILRFGVSVLIDGLLFATLT